MDRYGEEIEVDLHRIHGVDLLDFFKGNLSWRKLHLLIKTMPGNSLYVQALANDPEVAEQIVQDEQERRRQGVSKSSDGPSVVDYTMEVARLDLLIELAQVIHSDLSQLSGGKAQTVRPQPRPETAVDRARKNAAWARHEQMDDEVEAARERRRQRKTA